MKQNGKILPAKMGPVPSTNRVSGGKLELRDELQIMPTPSSSTTPSLTNVLR